MLTSDGTLTVKGTTTPVTATGRIAGPAITLGDVEKIGIDLETTVDRDTIGLQCGTRRCPREASCSATTSRSRSRSSCARADEDEEN